MVEGLAPNRNLLQFSTPPPTLRQLFLIVMEMASWIKNSSGSERNIVLVHQSDLHSSNPTMTLACLIALMNRELFIDGPMEVLPFIQNLG